MNIRNVPFRIETAVVSGLCDTLCVRPSSAPFLSGDGFRALAKHRYGPGRDGLFDPSAVAGGDLVYCHASAARAFLAGPARMIKTRFVLISGNSDTTIDDSFDGMLPRQLMHWFAQNARSSDPKISILPIGLENRALHCNGVVGDFKRLRRKMPVKKDRLLYGFTAANNTPAREPALAALRRSLVADAIERVNSRFYRKILARYCMVASPPGNGEDCHRTWEAMYLRVLPVVLRSALMEKYEALGLPIVLIEDWEEIIGWDEERIAGLYQRKAALFNSPVLYLNWWKAEILRKVSDARSENAENAISGGGRAESKKTLTS